MDQGSNTPGRICINILSMGLHIGRHETAAAAYDVSGCPYFTDLGDIRERLRDRKALKLMSKQDQMAVACTAVALSHHGLESGELQSDTGIYFTVGNLPFEQQPLQMLTQLSCDGNGVFSMEAFSQQAYQNMNPLLTFKCLPNMPLFHVSHQFGIQGSYFINYSTAGQWLLGLRQAVLDLHAGRIRYAIVAMIADQQNPLVEFYYRRAHNRHPVLLDSACVWLLSGDATTGLGQICLQGVEYTAPQNPLHISEHIAGPVHDALRISEAIIRGRRYERVIDSPDGIGGVMRFIPGGHDD